MTWPLPNLEMALQKARLNRFVDVPAGFSNLEGLWRPWRGLYHLTSGKVDQLDDESGNARHMTQATALFRPTIGTGGELEHLVASGGQVMVVPEAFGVALGTNNFTIWVVFDTDDLSANEGGFATSLLGGIAGTIETSNRSLRRQGGGVCTDGAAALDTKELWHIWRDSGTLHLEVNGVDKTLSTPTAAIGSPSGDGALLALDTTLTFTLSGRVWEAGGTSDVLTPTERAAHVANADLLYGLG